MLRPSFKTGLVVVLIFGAVTLVHVTPFKDLLFRWHEASLYVRGLGWAGPVVMVFGTAALVAAGCPRLLLCPVAGAAFGFFWGLLWSQIGTLLGSYATFLFVRWGGRSLALRRWPKLARYAGAISEGGVLSVILVRQLPLNSAVLTSLLGLTTLRHRHFLLGTAIGILPEAVPATLLGAGAAQLSYERAAFYVAVGIGLFAVVQLVRKRLSRLAHRKSDLIRPGEIQNLMEKENERSKRS